MIEWQVDAMLRGSEAGERFATLDAVFALDGEMITRSPLSRVLRVTADGKRYYVKRYAGNRRHGDWFGLRSLLARTRVRREWENLQAFASWGVPTARVVAYGAEYRLGTIVRGALITEEIPDTMDLAHMVRIADPRLRDASWLAGVSRQLATAVRKMHDKGFAHNDLKWRNLLVDRQLPARLYFIDCPTGSYWPAPFLQYRIVKDLACLDKIAKYQLSKTRRLRFYLDYVGHARLDARDRKRIARILAFFEGRE